jgi:hypothetical protein
MSPYVIGGLIGAAGTLLVWGLSALRDHFIEKQRRREYDRTVLKGALVEYLAALDALTLELMDQPPPPVPTVIDRSFDRLVDKLGLAWTLTVIVRILRRVAYGNRPYELTDRLAAASAHLRLVAPPAVLDLMQQLDVLFRKFEHRDETWRAEWESTREQLRSGFRDALNA